MRALNRVEVRERQAEGHKYGDDYKHHKQQNEWKTQVSKETGVPIGLLHGSTLEEMQANGKALADYITEKTKPNVHASSESNQPPAPSGASGDWLRDQYLQTK